MIFRFAPISIMFVLMAVGTNHPWWKVFVLVPVLVFIVCAWFNYSIEKQIDERIKKAAVE